MNAFAWCRALFDPRSHKFQLVMGYFRSQRKSRKEVMTHSTYPKHDGINFLIFLLSDFQKNFDYCTVLYVHIYVHMYLCVWDIQVCKAQLQTYPNIFWLDVDDN